MSDVVYTEGFDQHNGCKETSCHISSSSLHNCYKRLVFGQPIWVSYHLQQVWALDFGLFREQYSVVGANLWTGLLVFHREMISVAGYAYLLANDM